MKFNKNKNYKKKSTKLYMNLLIYLIFIVLYTNVSMPLIGQYETQPLYQKLYFFVGTVIAHYIFIVISDFINNKKKSLREVTDKCLIGSFSVLFGLLIYYDLDDTKSINDLIPNLNEFYNQRWFQTTVIVIPSIIINLLRMILLTPF